jgi:hypothetical protein
MAKRIPEDPMFPYLMQLVGGKITQVITEFDVGGGPDHYYGFVVEKEDKAYDCIILCDPEANGPGHLDIEKEKYGT